MSAAAELPEPVRSQIAAMMAQRDLETERARADRMREDSNKLYELRGWLRLCEDNPAGHAEFYRWACHYIFGDPPPVDDENEQPPTVSLWPAPPQPGIGGSSGQCTGPVVAGAGGGGGGGGRTRPAGPGGGGGH